MSYKKPLKKYRFSYIKSHSILHTKHMEFSLKFIIKKNWKQLLLIENSSIDRRWHPFEPINLLLFESDYSFFSIFNSPSMLCGEFWVISSFFAAAIAATYWWRPLPLSQYKADMVVTVASHRSLQVYVCLLVTKESKCMKKKNTRQTIAKIHLLYTRKVMEMVVDFLSLPYCKILFCALHLGGEQVNGTVFPFRIFYSIFNMSKRSGTWHFIYIDYNAYSNCTFNDIFNFIYIFKPLRMLLLMLRLKQTFIRSNHHVRKDAIKPTG